MGTNLSRARKTIQNAIELAEEERRRKLLQQRLEIARTGLQAYRNHRIAEAVKAFQTYLKILEEVKNVGEGALVPNNFDKKKDLSELLMLSGVYWDLVKLYDRTQSAEKRKDFLHYMSKYIMFSKGMPFQHLAAETLRKYIQGEKPVHKDDFKNAYAMLGGTNCFVATSLLDVTDEKTIPVLRKFRDQILKKTKPGRIFVLGYYRWGPEVARLISKLPEGPRKILGMNLNFFVYLLIPLVNQSSNSSGSKDKLAIRKTYPQR